MKTSSITAELFDQIGEIETQSKIQESLITAFLPEEARFERLREEAETLLSRFPHPEKRPALFGVPAGVKDIFHVDGFKTRAGSHLPIEVLQGAEAESVRLKKNAGRFLGKVRLEHWQKVCTKTEAKFGKNKMDVMFHDSAYQLTHNTLFPHDCIHVENLGGEIGLIELQNKRLMLGAFPWKFKGDEAAFCRAVAFAEE